MLYKLLTSLAQTLVFGGVWELGFTHGDLIWSFPFVHFFIKSCPECDLAAGARFGLLIGIFFCSPHGVRLFPAPGNRRRRPGGLFHLERASSDSSRRYSLDKGGGLVWAYRAEDNRLWGGRVASSTPETRRHKHLRLRG